MPGIDLKMTIDWRGVLAEELAPDILVPVYSPNILDASAHLDDPAVIPDLPLIHTTSRSDAWAGWMKDHGLSEFPATPRMGTGTFFHVAGRGPARPGRRLRSRYRRYQHQHTRLGRGTKLSSSQRGRVASAKYLE